MPTKVRFWEADALIEPPLPLLPDAEIVPPRLALPAEAPTKIEPPVVPLASKLAVENTSFAATLTVPAIPVTALALTNPAKLALPFTTFRFTWPALAWVFWVLFWALFVLVFELVLVAASALMVAVEVVVKLLLAVTLTVPPEAKLLLEALAKVLEFALETCGPTVTTMTGDAEVELEFTPVFALPDIAGVLFITSIMVVWPAAELVVAVLIAALNALLLKLLMVTILVFGAVALTLVVTVGATL